MATFTDPVQSLTAISVGTGTNGQNFVPTATLGANGVLTLSFANITAGTTQTQAGATAITTQTARVTVGTAVDGVRLPALSTALIGTQITIINSSATLAAQLYASGSNTINGTAGATGIVLTAAKIFVAIATSATTWVTYVGA